MSWGERSCIHAGKCPIPDECEIETCNVDCRAYKFDGKTKPDSVSKKRIGYTKEELAAARADNPAPFGNKGYLSADDIKPMDRAAKIAIRALRKANKNMTVRDFGKETRQLILLALLEIETLYE